MCNIHSVINVRCVQCSLCIGVRCCLRLPVWEYRWAGRQGGHVGVTGEHEKEGERGRTKLEVRLESFKSVKIRILEEVSYVRMLKVRLEVGFVGLRLIIRES